MIRAIIRFSAKNRLLVLLATAVAVAYGVYTLRHIPVDAIPDLSDTQVIVYSRWDRSPDIIEDQVTYPIVTALLGAPNVKTIRGFSDFGFSLRLRHLQGRHRPLLGAQPRARVPEQDPAAAAGGRADRARARRHRRRLGVPVRARGRQRASLPRRPAHVPGLEPALPPAVGARASPRWRRSAASCSSTRSRWTRTGCKAYDLAHHATSPTAVRAQQQRGGRPPARVLGHASTWSAAAATCSSTRGPRVDRPQDGRNAARPCSLRDVGQVALGPGDPARRRRPRRRAATWSAASWSCATAKTRATSSAACKERLQEIEPSLPGGRAGRHHLRPLGADPARRSTP